MGTWENVIAYGTSTAMRNQLIGWKVNLPRLKDRRATMSVLVPDLGMLRAAFHRSFFG